MVVFLKAAGHDVNRKRVQGLMRKMGLAGMAPGPNTSHPHPDHKVYPYLLRGVSVVKPDQVWGTDITYIRLAHGFAYLVAIIVMSSYASIRVTAAKEVAGKKVQVWAIKEAGAEGKDAAKAALVDKKVPADGGTVRKMVFTSPFGRVYRLKVEGYVGTTVKVYPFAGKQVVPEKDLRPSPSVLFRPPPGILSKSFEVKVGNKVALSLSKYGCKAMLLGSEHKVPSSLLADWNLELDLLLAE